MQIQVTETVTAAIEQQNALLEEPIDLSKGADSPLYGKQSKIDSLTLVSILVDIETTLRAELGIEARLADTSDLPTAATPFATFGTLCDYVDTRCTSLLAMQE